MQLLVQARLHEGEDVGVGGEAVAGEPPGEAYGEQGDDGHQQPADEPPAVDTPTDADVAEKGLLVHGLADKGGDKGEEHTGSGHDNTGDSV